MARTILQLREFLEQLPDSAHVWIDARTNTLITDADDITCYPMGNEPHEYEYDEMVDVEADGGYYEIGCNYLANCLRIPTYDS